MNEKEKCELNKILLSEFTDSFLFEYGETATAIKKIEKEIKEREREISKHEEAVIELRNNLFYLKGVRNTLFGVALDLGI